MTTDSQPMVPCTIAQRHLTKPDGGVNICWVVTAIEPEGEATAVFSGHGACARAEAYARERYKPIHRRMMADPGVYGARGGSAALNHEGGHNGH